MKTITDIRPSALMREIGWGTGGFVRGKDGVLIALDNAAELIRSGNADKIQCFCIVGALRTASILGAFTDQIGSKIKAHLGKIARDARVGHIENLNDGWDATREMMIGHMGDAERQAGIFDPIPLKNT